MSINSTNPEDLFGGIWEQITNSFLLAASSTHKVGTTGGAESHTLTKNEMPSHSHTQLGIVGESANSSPVRLQVQNDGNVVLYDVDDTALWTVKTSSANDKVYRQTKINVDGVTGETGSGTAFSIMPPYLSVYMWKRIA